MHICLLVAGVYIQLTQTASKHVKIAVNVNITNFIGIQITSNTLDYRMSPTGRENIHLFYRIDDY